MLQKDLTPLKNSRVSVKCYGLSSLGRRVSASLMTAGSAMPKRFSAISKWRDKDDRVRSAN
jgi:hypothetical protein